MNESGMDATAIIMFVEIFHFFFPLNGWMNEWMPIQQPFVGLNWGSPHNK